MKKFVCVLLLISGVLCSRSQKSYFNVKVSYALFGTTRMLRAAMEHSGLNQRATVLFVVNYPRSSRYPSVMLEGGKFIGSKKSISALAGLQEAGWVKGYNGMNGVRLDYANWILNPKINFHRSGAVLGMGPSALVLRYRKNKHDFGETYQQSKLLPGVSLFAESVSKKSKGFRLGVFASLNLFPTFEIKPVKIESSTSSFYFESKINPSSLNLGFRFQF